MDPNSRIRLLDTPIDVLTMEESLAMIDAGITEGRKIRHAAVNAATLVAMRSDPELKESVTSCDLITADGMSLIWASRFLGKPLPERIAGPDLMCEIVKLAERKGYGIYLLGAKDSVVRKVASEYASRFSESIVAGYHHGYFSETDEKEIVQTIADSHAKILFVAITSPKKEIFLRRHENELNVPFIMGVGGSFDIVAGIIKRAPRWMQRSGLEWFYRFLQEPRRMWKRYLVSNTRFIWYVLKEKFFS